MGTATGNITYYCLCHGGACDNGTGGACADCIDNYDEIAWPNTNGIDESCGLVSHSCGDVVLTKNICNGSYVTGYIHDHCPCAPQEGCSRTPNCNGSPYYDSSYYTVLFDATVGYFLDLNGRLDEGRIPVYISA